VYKDGALLLTAKETTVSMESASPRSWRRRHPSLSDSLQEELLRLIREENLRSGDRLPPVRSLAERFSVAPPTVREALRRLQANGVVEMRHGSGTYIRSDRERMVLVNPDHGELWVGAIPQLLETRALIEPRAAELAAQNAGEAEIGKLEELLKEAEGYLRGDDESLHRTNMGLHCAIAQCSGNFILAQVLESLVELYPFEQLAIMEFYNDRRSDHEEHRVIVGAIKDGDAARANELMREHILGVKSVVEKRLRSEG
jgi:GntR family transcriptional regulator, transcriptional repressor for pyruvate dehydrogenase complex